MPNLIDNYIEVSGPAESLAAFKRRLAVVNGSLLVDGETEDPGDSFGPEFRWVNKKSPLAFRTQTDWSYPVAVLEKASGEHPDLIFEVFFIGHIPDGDFGHVRFTGGEIVGRIPKKELLTLDFIRDVMGEPVKEWQKEREAELLDDIATYKRQPKPERARAQDDGATGIVVGWFGLIAVLGGVAYLKNRQE